MKKLQNFMGHPVQIQLCIELYVEFLLNVLKLNLIFVLTKARFYKKIHKDMVKAKICKNYPSDTSDTGQKHGVIRVNFASTQIFILYRSFLIINGL